jgi:hypothetical protein
LFYLPTGISGYVKFGSRTPQDILAIPTAVGNAAGSSSMGFSADDKWVLVARLGTLFNSAMCFTINFFPARYFTASYRIGID